VGRRPEPAIRGALRERAIDYVTQHGFASVSLRPMAKKLRTSARMLVYHFGSREGLMREVLMGIREREDATIQSWFQKRKRPPTMPDFLRWYWQRMGAAKARPMAQMIFELDALALRDPARYPGVLTGPIAYWRGLSQRVEIRRRNDTEATLLLAVTRGLLLDVTATGDRARVWKAFRLLTNFIERSDEETKRRGAGKRALKRQRLSNLLEISH